MRLVTDQTDLFSMLKMLYFHQKQARQQNIAVVLRDLWHHAPLFKAALAQRNGLTKATISLMCNGLAALDLIRCFQGRR